MGSKLSVNAYAINVCVCVFRTEFNDRNVTLGIDILFFAVIASSTQCVPSGTLHAAIM